MRTVGSLLVILSMLACSKPEQKAKPAVKEAAPAVQDAPPAVAVTCANNVFPGFADVQAAFAEYARAIHDKDWCRAVNTFVPEDRAELSVTAFQALGLLAGAPNPKRESHLLQFQQLCQMYRLTCAEPARVGLVAQAMMTHVSVDEAEPNVRAVAAKMPEQFYVDVLTMLIDVDNGGLKELAPQLENVRGTADHVSGTAKDSAGAVITFSAKKRASGWLLSAR